MTVPAPAAVVSAAPLFQDRSLRLWASFRARSEKRKAFSFRGEETAVQQSHPESRSIFIVIITVVCFMSVSYLVM